MNIRYQQNSRLIHILFFVLLLLPFTAMAAEDTHIPEGIIMQEEFKPGYGEHLGIFKKTVGPVVLIHELDTFGYWAEQNLPLYMKDTVVTPEEGLALLQFLDESTISVAADSELIINTFIFDPAKFDRSTFISMKSGKARFWVEKYRGYRRSEFKVKTQTMIAGVRGSDFIIIAMPDKTQVIALDDTVIEIINLAAPDEILLLRSFEKIGIEAGREVLPPEKITPDEAAGLRRTVPMPFDPATTEGSESLTTDEVKEPDKSDDAASPVKDEIIPIVTVGAEERPVIVPEDDLVPPDTLPEDRTNAVIPETDADWFDKSLDEGTGTGIVEQGQELIDDRSEELILPLPGLPETP